MATSAAEARRPHQKQQQQQQQQQHSPSQTLPSISALTNGLPTPSQHSPQNRPGQNPPSRDSGTWPHPQSKHSSMNNPSLHVSSLLNADESQPRGSMPSTPTSVRLSQHPSVPLPSINQGFESTNQGRQDYHPSMESRRSSIDSRVHTGFSNLGLNNPTSPYESQNASQVSLAASLRRPNGGQPMSPLSARRTSHHAPRIAPPIVSNRPTGAPDPMAARPTQGFPWAFPDSVIPEEQQTRGSSSDDSSVRNSISRHNSFAASSVRSSIFSVESSLPAGQRRFDDDSTTHHHQMQHRTIASLQNEGTPMPGGGNYSRTPELRISHKLAERKRRSEMKDLFEDLNKAVPTNGGAKASKWEILTKAIEYIRTNQAQERNVHAEMNRLRVEADYAREAHKESEILQSELRIMHERLMRLDPNGHHVYGQYTQRLVQTQQQPPQQGNPQSQYALPPMNTGAAQQHYPQMAPVNAMQGVEYGVPGRGSYEMR